MRIGGAARRPGLDLNESGAGRSHPRVKNDTGRIPLQEYSQNGYSFDKL
jgi:hypothetical protein